MLFFRIVQHFEVEMKKKIGEIIRVMLEGFEVREKFSLFFTNFYLNFVVFYSFLNKISNICFKIEFFL